MITLKFDTLKVIYPSLVCEPNMFLTCDYKIELLNADDSLVFTSGNSSNTVTYHIKRLKL